MGFARDNIVTASEMAVGLNKAETVFVIPREACEGQMTFHNVGDKTLFVHVSGRRPTSKDYYVKLLAGKAYTEDGIIPGEVSVISAEAGGIFSANASFANKR